MTGLQQADRSPVDQLQIRIISFRNIIQKTINRNVNIITKKQLPDIKGSCFGFSYFHIRYIINITI